MSHDNTGPGLLGTLFIGAVGGALAVILTDAKKRQKLRNTIGDWIETGQEKIGEAKEQLEETTTKGRRQLARKIDPDQEQ